MHILKIVLNMSIIDQHLLSIKMENALCNTKTVYLMVLALDLSQMANLF